MEQRKLTKNLIQKVLLVEDDELIQMVHHSMLTSIGYAADIAGSGKEALSLFKENDYCAILLDVGLPDMTGIEVAKAIRAFDGKKCDMPIIAATAYLQEDIMQQALKAGINIVMSKPVPAENFDKALKDLTHNEFC